jgi:hypothetical protein
MQDLDVLQVAADELRVLLGDYAGPVTAAGMSLAAQEPRQWTSSTGATGWILGPRRLVGWLQHFPPCGFSPADLVALRAAIAATTSRVRPARVPAALSSRPQG